MMMPGIKLLAACSPLCSSIEIRALKLSFALLCFFDALFILSSSFRLYTAIAHWDGWIELGCGEMGDGKCSELVIRLLERMESYL